ncbi:nitrilase-related carbon-nitrogen hydrolase [Glycomyces paridis]|uniref:CN hydrolase domain-containing protein n=1 Tax=Glycomyces paridis TaxID=2126555 RepID=A0A4S8PL04_9ACTN|nr:nitrilase-related carbon-nitrogen hydrolase [Glycomyces paridis]THV31420.1 hypothetical protein E9998_03395 [Glycomyces paridis]
MASRPSPLTVLGAALASAVLLALSFPVQPLAWAVWIAPLPLLWIAPRVGARTALLAAAAAWLAGQARVLWYLHDPVGTPTLLLAVSGLLTTALYTGATMLFRALAVRGRITLAAFAFPAAVTAAEYAVSIVNGKAAGQWWSFAYTQADVAAVLQLAAVTGIWGLTFLVTAASSVIAAATAPGASARTRAWTGGALATALALTVAYGLQRPAPAEETVRAGALALPAPTDSLPVDTPAAEALFADYREVLTDLSGEADLLVLPEKTFSVRADDDPAAYLDRWSDLAADTGIDLVLGLALEADGEFYNVAVWLPADGSATAVYRKQHLVAGVEDWITASDDGPVTVPGTGDRWAMTICKDLDYTRTMAEYGDAALVLAPALDFHEDGWWHSRVALTRGVEQGFALVRTGQYGRMTVSDPYGRVLAEDERLALAAVPVDGADTVYSRFGDWFLAPTAAVLVLGLVLARRRPRSTLDTTAPPPGSAG